MRAQPIVRDSQVEALLTEAQLPTADLASSRGLNLFGVREGDRLIEVVGVELYGDVGLLRSLVVQATHRNRGLASRLVACAETWAAEQGVEALGLLTTTAAPFFAKRGYQAVSRSDAPAAARQARSFRLFVLCLRL